MINPKDMSFIPIHESWHNDNAHKIEYKLTPRIHRPKTASSNANRYNNNLIRPSTATRPSTAKRSHSNNTNNTRPNTARVETAKKQEESKENEQ